ncbi:uncharacterized protein LOC111566951 isoform X2 [Amphiprion ocellaris]|uniref:uncharacterized protein LOC111566951 isoform X2 n=1 Tax=Amphiprion ocellaris TaxID=80972 RepID=UPI00241120E0|nr:uncharacterized protein LOC111566951 isoform X2 [Amphiprion ocellaris]
MARTQLILIFLLQFTAGSSRDHFLYYRLGNDVTLPCGDVSSSETRCFLFTWFHERNEDSRDVIKVDKGKVNKYLPGGDRLSLSRNCFLIINKVTAEDAGRYTCRTMYTTEPLVHLNILTISPSPPDADPKTDDEVTLKCSLLRFGSCPLNSIRWVDEKGTVLLGEGDGFKFDGQTDCVSLLTVKHQSSHNNRRYTCQFIERNIVKIDAHYTPVEVTSNNTIIIVSVVVGMLVVLVVITAVLIKCRRRAKMTEDAQKPTQAQDEPGGNLTYVTINHTNYNPKKKVKVKEEAVTYSTIKTTVKMEANIDPSSFYSSVR